MQDQIPAELPSFDLAESRQAVVQSLSGSGELDDLVSQIAVYEPQSILSFGQGAASQIARCSDEILRTASAGTAGDPEPLMAALSRVMARFDVEEAAGKKGISKFFGDRKKDLDKLLAKYHTMGEEVDKIYIALRKYEEEIAASNRKLQAIFDANLDYYRELVKYILAGEQGLNEIEDYQVQLQREADSRPGDAVLQMDRDTVQQSHTLLEHRIHDLRIAEVVAMQALPMLRTMQRNNLNLIRQINSAFIVTLPIFKQALAQAVLLKRQRIQAQSLRALEERTSALLRKNAQDAAGLAAQRSGEAETLTQTWKTIVNGIEETRSLRAGAGAGQASDAAKLEALRQELQT